MPADFRCATCDGYGVVGDEVDQPCPECRGSGLAGETPDKEQEARGPDIHQDLHLPLLDRGAEAKVYKLLTLPRNIGEGTVLRIHGGGQPGAVGPGDLYLHIRRIAPLQGDAPVDQPAAATASATHPVAWGATPEDEPSPATSEEAAMSAVRSYVVRLVPDEEPLISFAWPCDHGPRARCAETAVWHVRVNDQVGTVHSDGRVEVSFPTLLRRGADPRPSREALEILNPELASKDPGAVGRLLGLIEGHAQWDGHGHRFVCVDSGSVTTIQALDYYVDNPDVWLMRTKAASRAAIDDEMQEANNALTSSSLAR
jgi:hypothetical protein